ncbi:MAG TPA: DUF4126 domain-containing protein [Blastocatellia bacterium]|nr:DUF4126 domain-containing protein [Blastocatellia bacterium]HMY71327.1 DUF4126 domain-containing protein [Blastocatellia bacterium]HMZ17304.1 DUF4126 domain-containing protein [Blastocatellia bacterium]HNG30184.1 DUF4126 domain-containing protein [Blastocatellia bacterium]
MSADWLTTVSLATGSALFSGVNVYATAVTLGVLQRFHLVKLPGEMAMLGNWWVIGLAGAMYLIQFVADKIPAVDSVWDAVHTFIRVPAGAVLAATAFADFDPRVKWTAMLIGGTLALGSHGMKSAVRLVANASPEPISNFVLSVTEDGLTFGSIILIVFFPVLIFVVLAVFLILLIWLGPKVFRALKRLFARAQKLFSARGEPAPSQTP